MNFPTLQFRKKAVTEAKTSIRDEEDRIFATIIAYCKKPAFMQGRPFPANPFLEKENLGAITSWFWEEMNELKAVRSTSRNVVFNLFSELDDVLNLLLELRARKVKFSSAEEDDISKVLDKMQSATGSGSVYFAIHNLKSQLRAEILAED